mmetsp:Transcript_14364/g.22424  ORF Transcript_14364/g.22424 Transcript_14364/m.22424 type:complete len:679 (-) Transcript_14364:760-2796(-)
MVLAVLANQFAPSSRGLIRKVKQSSYHQNRGRDNNGSRGLISHQKNSRETHQRRPSIWSGYNEQHGTPHLGHMQENDDHDTEEKENSISNLSATSSLNDASNHNNSLRQTPSIEMPEQDYRRHVSFYKRKPFRAMSALISVAADLDVIGDWWFYISTLKEERAYRADAISVSQQYGRNADELPMYRVPQWLMTTLLIICIAGTFMWLILATDGRFLTPLLQRLQIDSLSMGTMLFLCVVIEDIPQVVLTFLVEDYYEEDTLSKVALINLISSLYDTLIKIAEAYDERNDIVETGVWVRDSIWAHKKDVTSIIVLPPEKEPSHAESTAKTMANELCGKVELSTSSASSFDSTDNTYILDEQEGDGSTSRRSTSWVRNYWRRVIGISEDSEWVTHSLRRAAGVGQNIPHIQFLTSSLDSTIRLWDTNHYRPNHRRKQCVRTLRNKSRTEGITCMTLFGKGIGHETSSHNNDNSLPLNYHNSLKENPVENEELNDSDTFIIAGGINGTAYLWTLAGKCIQTFNGGMTGRVTSVASIDPGITFACGYVDSRARIWDAATGSLLHQFIGHRKYVTSVCSMGDRLRFVTGSADESIKLWHADDSTDVLAFSSERVIMGSRGEADNYVNAGIQKCKRTFVGHTGRKMLCYRITSVLFLHLTNLSCVRAFIMFLLHRHSDIISGMC